MWGMGAGTARWKSKRAQNVISPSRNDSLQSWGSRNFSTLQHWAEKYSHSFHQSLSQEKAVVTALGIN